MSSIHPQTYTRMRSETPASSHGSRTLTVEEEEREYKDKADSASEEEEEQEPVGVLHLRGDMNARRRQVIQWDDSVIDNEHMNKKKSKICCIYHKPRPVGESSDESSSSSSDDSSGGSDDSDSESGRTSRHTPHTGACNHSHSKRRKKKNPREVSPNAYERMPNYNK